MSVVGRYMVSRQGKEFLIEVGEFFQLHHGKQSHLF